MKNNFAKFIISIFVAILFFPVCAGAEEGARSYSYEAISQTYTINVDSTVDVAESQTFNYVGEYHKGWRAILLKGVGSIDNISVVDKDTGEVYKKVSSTLDKTDPKSWGKYTTYAENGHQNIEWYYNLKDTSHTFTLKYRLHGAIGFFNDRDELYWNLATEYGVPIKHIEATVVLPSNVSSDKLYGYFYDELFAKDFAPKIAEELTNFDAAMIKDVVTSFLESYDPSDDQQTWFDKVKQAAEKSGFATDNKAYKANPKQFRGNVADFAKILRVKLTGKNRTPDLHTIMQVMGIKRIKNRLA